MKKKELLIKISNLEDEMEIMAEKYKNGGQSLKSIVDEEFRRFGFARIESDPYIIFWEMESERHRQNIIIDRRANMLILEQYRNVGGDWVKEGFGVMAPLFEVIELARHAYSISSSTRSYNKKWSVNRIIKGTEGNNGTK